MKVRNGFVSNSSSSSFVLRVDKNNVESFINDKLFFSEIGEYDNDIKEIVIRDVKAFFNKPLMEQVEELYEEIDCFINKIIFYFERNDNEYYKNHGKTYLQALYEALRVKPSLWVYLRIKLCVFLNTLPEKNSTPLRCRFWKYNLVSNIVKSIRKSLVNKGADMYSLCVISYGDEGGDIYADIEHGNYFKDMEGLWVSHH